MQWSLETNFKQEVAAATGSKEGRRRGPQLWRLVNLSTFPNCLLPRCTEFFILCNKYSTRLFCRILFAFVVNLTPNFYKVRLDFSFDDFFFQQMRILRNMDRQLCWTSKHTSMHCSKGQRMICDSTIHTGVCVCVCVCVRGTVVWLSREYHNHFVERKLDECLGIYIYLFMENFWCGFVLLAFNNISNHGLCFNEL